jgi:hypothetical protein
MYFALFDTFNMCNTSRCPIRLTYNFNAILANTFHEDTNPSRNKCVLIASLIVRECTVNYLSV